MAYRLDNQRATRKAHRRQAVRNYRRGYRVVPHTPWGNANSVYATGATAGTPGSFTPAGRLAPAEPGQLVSGANPITPSPGTAWTTGQFVQTQTSGTGGRAYWNGTAWVAGTAS